MSDAVVLGERLLALLDESSRSSTYKPALLLAVLDVAPAQPPNAPVPVRQLARRVIELYWPQTVAYPTTGEVLLQNQAGGQATIVRDIAAFRRDHGLTSRALGEDARRGPAWDELVTKVERTLAEWPIPRLQRPYEPFLYHFDWPWEEAGRWSVRAYGASSRALTLHPGVLDALVALGPLLRPFITQWWADKAARLNPRVEAARSLVEFEEFLFGRDRAVLARIAEDLLDLQAGACFYCAQRLTRERQIDHFVPWSHSGDDGIDNLVAACRRCNLGKRATLAGPGHLAALLERNRRWTADLSSIAETKRWPRDPARTAAIVRTTYLRSADDRPAWHVRDGMTTVDRLGLHRSAIAAALGV